MVVIAGLDSTSRGQTTAPSVAHEVPTIFPAALPVPWPPPSVATTPDGPGVRLCGPLAVARWASP